MNAEEQPTALPPVEQFIEDLLRDVQDPYHQRIIRAYAGADPLAAIEEELKEIVRGIVDDGS